MLKQHKNKKLETASLQFTACYVIQVVSLFKCFFGNFKKYSKSYHTQLQWRAVSEVSMAASQIGKHQEWSIYKQSADAETT